MIRGNDQSLVKIDRSIPLWGILSVCALLAGNGVTTYFGFQKWADATAENTQELKRLSGIVSAMDVRYAEMNARLQEHERRLNEIGARVMMVEQQRK